MILTRVLISFYLSLFILVISSCSPSPPKKDTELINEVIADSLEVVADEIDSVIVEKEIKVVARPVTISFDLAQIQPIYPGCTQQKQVSKNLCFKKKVNLFIEEKLTINDFLKQNVAIGYHTIPYSFVIDKTGNVKETSVKADPVIARNIKQSLMQLPKLQPGRQDNLPTAIAFSNEIKIYVGKQKSNGEVKIKVDGQEIMANIPSNLSIQMVDRAPIFPGCEGKSGIPLIKCTSSKINSFIANTINQDNLKGYNLPKGKHSIKIYFTITNKGSVSDVSIQNQHEVIRNEVTRVVKSIPTMSPALYEKIKVPINYHVTLTTNISMED